MKQLHKSLAKLYEMTKVWTEFFKAHQISFPWMAWQWTHCHLSTLGVDHAFLSAKHGLEATYKSFSDNGEKNSLSVFETSVHLWCNDARASRNKSLVQFCIIHHIWLNNTIKAAGCLSLPYRRWRQTDF